MSFYDQIDPFLPPDDEWENDYERIEDVPPELYSPLMDYRKTDMSTGNLGFCNPKITPKDYQMLCQRLQLLSNNTINRFFFDKPYSNDPDIKQFQQHCNINFYRGNWKLLKLLNELIGRELKEAEAPTFGEFPLYTSETKSPRIFFIYGKKGIFHLLFFDLDHQIFPKPLK
jgi:hypothetical protein